MKRYRGTVFKRRGKCTPKHTTWQYSLQAVVKEYAKKWDTKEYMMEAHDEKGKLQCIIMREIT